MGPGNIPYSEDIWKIASAVVPSPKSLEILSLDFIGVRVPAAATTSHRIKHPYAPIVRASTQWNYSTSNNVHDARRASARFLSPSPGRASIWPELGSTEMPILADSLCHIFYLLFLCACPTSFAPASATLLRNEQFLPSLSTSISPYLDRSGL